MSPSLRLLVLTIALTTAGCRQKADSPAGADGSVDRRPAAAPRRAPRAAPPAPAGPASREAKDPSRLLEDFR